MKKFKNGLLSVAIMTAIFMGFSSPAFADFDFSIIQSYRVDAINRTSRSKDAQNYAEESFRATHSSVDYSIYQVGGHVIWEDKCLRLYSKVEGYYGWITQGSHYGVIGTYYNGTFNDPFVGQTINVSGRVGYIFPLNGCLEFVPLIGYGYDQIWGWFTVETRNTTENQVVIWAPYIGFDMRFKKTFCNCLPLDFTFGYEYHQGSGHLNRRFDDGNRTLDSFRHTIGHLFSLDTAYSFRNCWNIGLTLKYYTINNTMNALTSLKRVTVPPQDTGNRYSTSDWMVRSYLVALRVGYNY